MFIRQYIGISFAWVLAGLAPLSLAAQTLDTLNFGNSASESSHALVADFPAATYYTSASVTPTGAPSAALTGLLGQTARQLLPRLPTNDIYGGEMSFAMTVDPLNQNYFTIKLSGGDTNTASEWFVLDCNGYEVGWRHEGNDQELLWNQNPLNWFTNRFVYRTLPLPLSLTLGHTNVTLKIRSLGSISYYASSSGGYYNNYQKFMNAPSLGIFRAYTHTGGCLDASGEPQGTPPTFLTPLTTTTEATATNNWKTSVNNEVTALLGASPGTFTPDNVDFLAQCYGVSWTTGYSNASVVSQVIAGIDALVTAAAADTNGLQDYMGNFSNPSWGGYFGPVGDAIRLLYPQLSNTLSAVVAYGGTIGTTTRQLAWSAALRASVDYGRYNRHTISNQEISCCDNIYLANRGLLLVDATNALYETNALRYLYEASGVSPWLGNDQPGGGPTPASGTAPYGPNWYMTTTMGTTKEDAFVGSDYGEQGGTIYRMGVLATNASLKAQGLKMLAARDHFRFPTGDPNGYLVMYGEEATGCRNDQETSDHIAYLGRGYWQDLQAASFGAATIGTNLMGYMQQFENGGQLWGVLTGQSATTSGQPYVPGYLAAIDAQPQTGVVLPMTTGQPDFAWADEENMLIAAKHGSGTNEERFFAALNWHNADAINGLAKVFDLTPQTAWIAEVQNNDEQFNNSGLEVVRTGAVDGIWTPPDNPTNANNGLPFLTALRSDLSAVPSQNQDAGRGNGYTLRYGRWLVGINGDWTDKNYTVQLPSGFTSGMDLISGAIYTAPVVLTPKTAVVFYLATTSDTNPATGSPLFLNANGRASVVTLNWNAASGASSYLVQRATASAGPFTVLATNVTGLTYIDTNGLVNGGIYFYRVIGVSGAGTQGNPSPVAQAQAGLPSPWANADVGAVGLAGSTLFANGEFTVAGAGSDIGSTSDSFQFAWLPVSRNVVVIACLTNEVYSGSAGDKVGVMMRQSTNANAEMAMVMLNFNDAGSEARFATRASAGAGMNWEQLTNTYAAPLWFELTRTNNVFTGYVSLDGVNWTAVGAGVSIAMSDPILAGLAVCSRDGTSGLNYTTFANVNVTGWVPAPAPPAPAPPAVTSALGGNNQISLGWTASTNATSYNVKRSASSGGGYMTVANVSSNAWIDGSLPSGTAFYYVVSALNGGSESSNSVPATAVTIPSAPGIVTSVGWTNQVFLSWTASTGAASYNVKRSSSSGGDYLTLTNVARTSWTDSGLAYDATYYYAVSAVGSSAESSNSAPVAVTTLPGPMVWSAAPQNANWSLATNWVGGFGLVNGVSLTFSNSTITTLSNDLAGLTINGLDISGPGAFTLGGNALTLTGALTDGASAAENVTLAIGGAGSLVAAGGGSLTLSGTNTYSGATTVASGTLVMSSGMTGTGAVSVADGATLGVTASGSSQWPPRTLTVGSNSGAALQFAVGTNLIAPLKPGALILPNGTVTTINIASCPSAVGSHPLISYTTLSGAGVWSLGAQPANLSGHLSASGNTLNYVVDTVTRPTDFWTGAVNGNWDTSTANWINSAPTNVYTSGDPVQFDDTATGSTSVTVVSGVTPGGIVVTNNVNSYAIGGSAIGGSTTLIKAGTSTLTLSGVNTYSGPSTVTSGTLAFSGSGSIASSALTIGQPGSGNVCALTVTNVTSAGTTTRSASLTYGAAPVVSSGNALSLGNFTINGTSAGNTVEQFGALTLNPGVLRGTLVPNSAANLQLNFSSFTRNPGSVFYFGRSSIAPGTATIASATADTANLVFATAPTLVGGGGAAGSATVSILPGADVSTGLATYDTTYGLRALNTSTEMATLASGMSSSPAQNAKITTGTITISANTTINSLYGTGGTIAFGSDATSLAVNSGAILCGAGFTLGSGVAGGNGQLALGTAEGIIMVENARTLTVNSAITGSGGLTVYLDDFNGAAANLVLAGTNTFSGVTRAIGCSGLGSLAVNLNNSLALQNSTLDYNNYGARIVFNNSLTSFTLGGLKGAQSLALANNASAAVALTVGSSGDTDTAYAYSGVLSGAGSLIKAGPQTLTLTGANTYSGATTINNGTLALSGSGSIAGSANIILAPGAVFDVSGIGGGCALAGSQVLWATNKATATIYGSLSVGADGLTLGYANGVPALNVTGGALTLSAGTSLTVTVSNGGTPLPAGSYPLISTGAGGSVAGSLPATVTLSGDVNTNLTSLSLSNGELYLAVSSGTIHPPVLRGIRQAGSQMVLTFSGTNGQTYKVLTSTNVAAPLANWTAISTGVLTGLPISCTNGPAANTRQFYIITSP